MTRFIKNTHFDYSGKRSSKGILISRVIYSSDLQDCGSCGGGGCHRCCSKNPNNGPSDCASCGGSGCGRCCSKNPNNGPSDCANCGGSGCGRCCG